jgi:hypothetical protein
MMKIAVATNLTILRKKRPTTKDTNDEIDEDY